MTPQHHPTPRRRQEAESVSEADGNVTADDGDVPAISDDVAADDGDATVTVTAVERPSHDSTDVAGAIERERLRARIRVLLERELVASERHRQGLIERYEQLLAERSAVEPDRTGKSPQSPETPRSRLRRLLLGE